jgi:hypothetical protein
MSAPIRTDTNLGDLDFTGNTVSLLVDPLDVYIIIRIVPRFRVAPFVFTYQ